MLNLYFNKYILYINILAQSYLINYIHFIHRKFNLFNNSFNLSAKDYHLSNLKIQSIKYIKTSCFNATF